MKKNIIRVTAIILIITTLLAFTACGKKADVAGLYEGNSFNTLALKEDGTCAYAEFLMICYGQWHLKGNTLYIDLDSDSIPQLYADVSDFDGSFLLEADGDGWYDEVFTKVASPESES